MTYRPDIDGLRAISIVLVVLYHANVPLFSGGYVGVDVFFVISGYLITSLIWRDMAEGRFGWTAFMARRVRRLLPVAAVVLVATSVYAVLVLPPKELRDYAGSLAAFVLMGSNWFFLHSGGYFAAAAETKPLLHTWSLSIEEQFYLVFPLVLLALWRKGWRQHAPAVLAFLALLSLAYGAWLLERGWAERAFFHSFARAGGLLAGCGLALVHARASHTAGDTPSSLPPAVAHGLGWTGLLLVVLPGLFYNKSTAFPGMASWVPVAGALLVVQAGRSGLGVAPMLSWAPLTQLGRLSYGWYLWHWPLIVAVTTLWPDTAAWSALAAAGLSLGLSVLTYHAVEVPTRSRRLLPTSRHLLVLAVGVLVCGAVVALAGFNDKVGRKRSQWLFKDLGDVLVHIDASAQRYMDRMDKAYSGQSGMYQKDTHQGLPCSLDDAPQTSDVAVCLRDNLGAGGVLVMGDSIGRETFFALQSAFPGRNWTMLHQSSCMGVEFQNAVGKSCFPGWLPLLRPLIQGGLVRGVVLSARLFPEESNRYVDTVRVLRALGVPVAVVAGGPSYLSFVRDHVRQVYQTDGVLPLSVDANDHRMVREGQAQMVENLQAQAPKEGYWFVNTQPFYLQGGRYRLFVGPDGTVPLVFDREHMSLDAFDLYTRYLGQHKAMTAFLDKTTETP